MALAPKSSTPRVRILEATGVKFEWESFAAGAEAFEKYHEYIPKELTESIERTRVGLKGPVTTPIGGGFSSINVALRKQFELFANFRPDPQSAPVATRYPDVDLVIVRENTEGLYSGIEHEVVPGVVESLKIITEKASTRIAKFAFEYARKHKRKKIHAIHKANIMKLSDGLFIRCSRNVSKDYPEITYGEHIVDNTCMQLVMNPYQYDMLLLENLYGDIISRFVRGVCRRAGAGSGRELRPRLRHLRSRPRLGAGHRGQGHRQSDGGPALGHSDAAPPGRRERRQPHSPGAGESLRREEAHHPRCGRDRRYQRICRCHGGGAAHHSATETGVAGSGAVNLRRSGQRCYPCVYLSFRRRSTLHFPTLVPNRHNLLRVVNVVERVAIQHDQVCLFPYR